MVRIVFRSHWPKVIEWNILTKFSRFSSHCPLILCFVRFYHKFDKSPESDSLIIVVSWRYRFLFCPKLPLTERACTGELAGANLSWKLALISFDVPIRFADITQRGNAICMAMWHVKSREFSQIIQYYHRSSDRFHGQCFTDKWIACGNLKKGEFRSGTF